MEHHSRALAIGLLRKTLMALSSEKVKLPKNIVISDVSILRLRILSGCRDFKEMLIYFFEELPPPLEHFKSKML